MPRGALIGCGFIAPRHLKAWSSVAGVEIVAVCDEQEARARAVADRFSISHVFRSAAELCSALRDQLDFVDITTPPSSHVAVITTALAHGLHVLCQKPLAETTADLEAIVALATSQDRVVAVNEMWKFIPGYQHVGQILRDQAPGKIGAARFKSGSNFLLPRAGDDMPAVGLHPRFLAMERLIIFEYGIHVLDMLRHWFGDPRTVRATTSRVNPYCIGEDQATIALEFAGFRVDIDLDWCVAGPPILDVLDGDSLVVAGTEGVLTALGGRRVVWQPHAGGATVFSHAGDLRDAGFASTHGDFADAIRRGGRPASPVEDNARSVRLMLACYRSAANRGEEIEAPCLGAGPR